MYWSTSERFPPPARVPRHSMSALPLAFQGIPCLNTVAADAESASQSFDWLVYNLQPHHSTYTYVLWTGDSGLGERGHCGLKFTFKFIANW
jgi:hypothetical protein